MGIEAGASAQLCSQAGAWEQGGKGVATNAVQIAEVLVERGWLGF